MSRNKILLVQSVPVTIIEQAETDYISLTDMVRQSENGSAVIDNWLRNKNTLEFLSVWEEIYNPGFNSLEFEEIKKDAGLNRFTMSVKQWLTRTHATGVIAKAGRYGGTCAYQDKRNLTRSLSKINYRIHTDAIAQTLIPASITAQQTGLIYASEADVLNAALFGMTAKQWREQNPSSKGNIRDSGTVEQLVVLSHQRRVNSARCGAGRAAKDIKCHRYLSDAIVVG